MVVPIILALLCLFVLFTLLVDKLVAPHESDSRDDGFWDEIAVKYGAKEE